MQMCRRLEHIQRPGSGFQVFILVAEQADFPDANHVWFSKGLSFAWRLALGAWCLVLGGANSHLRDDDADGAALSRAP